MTQYIIQNDNEEYMAAFSKKRITWTKAPECAKTFDSREVLTVNPFLLCLAGPLAHV